MKSSCPFCFSSEAFSHGFCMVCLTATPKGSSVSRIRNPAMTYTDAITKSESTYQGKARTVPIGNQCNRELNFD